MRPIHLTLSGLHSYREAVEVDFEHLGEHGVFGIFGAIGSGKSTLLDGLTLALYGLVDRTATKSRAGIVNHHSKRIEVRLRFSISPGGEPEVYEVHRIYKRNSKGTAERVNSRLSRIEGDTAEVLVDKETELNDMIEKLLGLNPTDFMRAVVLPQGRFMRFLHLKGADRRAMLQRIFRLGAYGDGLRKQIRKRNETLELHLQGRRGELSGLGDASKKVIREAKRELAAAKEAQSEARARFDAVDATWAEAKEQRERQTRLAEAQRALAEHLEQAPAIEADRAALTRAEQAEALAEPHARHNRALERLDRSRENARLAKGAARDAREALQQAEAARARAEADRVAAAPGLVARTDQLKQAVSVHGDLQSRKAELAVLEARDAEVRQRSEQAASALDDLEARQTALDEERKAHTQALADCQIDHKEREHLQRVIRAHDQLRAVQERASEQDAQLVRERAHRDAVQSEVDRSRAARAQAAEAREAAQEALEALAEPTPLPDASALEAGLRDWERAWEAHERAVQATDRAALECQGATEIARQAAEQHAAAGVAGAELGAQLEQARATLAALEQQNQASVLASTLEDDAPCPVCGSHEHPAPAAPVPLDDGPVRALAAASARASAWLEASAERAARHAALADQAARRLADLEQAQARALAALEPVESRARGTLPDDLAWLDGPRQAIAAFEAHLLAAREAHAAAVSSREQARQALAEARLAEERAAAPVAAASARLDAVASDLAELQTARAATSDAESAAWAHFVDVQGNLTLFDVPRLQGEMLRKDTRSQELLPRIEALHEQAAKLADDLTAARAAAAATAGERSTLDEQLRAARRDVARLGTRLDDLCPDASPEEALTAARHRLEALEQAASKATEARDVARAAAEEADRNATVYQAEADSALTELSAASQELDRTLARLGLSLDDDLDTLIEGGLHPSERERLRARIDGWERQRIAHTSHVERAEAEAGEAVIEPRAWEALDARRTSASEALDAARAAAHSANHRVEELVTRAERYQALTGEIEVLERKLARLDELKALIRGDKLVDFLANDHLRELIRDANGHLRRLTDGRYALVLGEDASFEIRDADGGGSVRPVHTLSGGETFVASLALALALSTQVQARSQHPLEFFFLDEGFGSLDAEALDRVMGAIENLRHDSRTIGLISHVPAVRERVPRYLEVREPGKDGQVGSTLRVRDN